MRYPEFLPNGGTIGFVAPAFGCATEPYKSAFINAQKKFTEMGYKCLVGPNCYEDAGIGISNTPKACGEELTDFYCNDTTDVLISCGGGELMCETMDYVDFAKIANANPKWYMGYSDNTNFVFPLTTMYDTAAVYGPNAKAFGMEPWHEAIADAMDILRGQKLSFTGYDKWESESLSGGENPFAPYNCTQKSIIKAFPSDSFAMKGRLVGGCMDCLSNLCGTNFDHVQEFADKYKEDGVLWFLEACDLSVLSIRRALWEMDHAGWFKNASGFIIGRPYFFDKPIMGLDRYDAVTGVLAKYDVPILMDADIGHLPPAIPLISGSLAEVTVNGGKYRIDMELK